MFYYKNWFLIHFFNSNRCLFYLESTEMCSASAFVIGVVLDFSLGGNLQIAQGTVVPK